MMEHWLKLILPAIFGALLLIPQQAQSSSNLAAGSFAEAVQTGQTEKDVAICHLLTGPRDSLADNEFLLTLGDSNHANGDELQVTGEYKEEGSKRSEFHKLRLFPDREATAEYLEDLLRNLFNDPKLNFWLYTLNVETREVPVPGSNAREFRCKVRLTGRAASREIGSGPVLVTFDGLGQFTPGIEEAPPAVSSGKKGNAR